MKYLIFISMCLLCVTSALAQDGLSPADAVFVYTPQGWGFSYHYIWTPENILVIDDVMGDNVPNKGEPISVTFDPYAPRNTDLLPLPSATPATPSSHDHFLPPQFLDVLATSPDGRFDLYRVDSNFSIEGKYYHSFPVLGIVNHKTGKFTVLPGVMPFINLKITWTNNNESFLMTYHLVGLEYDEEIYTYVTGFGDDIALAHSATTLGGAFPDADGWFVNHFFDIDPTGRYLLVNGSYRIPGSDNRFDSALMLIDMTNLSYEIVASNASIRAANFEEPSQHVLYLSNDGVFAYDLQEKTTTLITDALNASQIYIFEIHEDIWPSFSPDGRYLATRINREWEELKLYVYAIPPIPESK